MHTFAAEDGTRFHFNSDFSGEVHIVLPDGRMLRVAGGAVRSFARTIVAQEVEAILERRAAAADAGDVDTGAAVSAALDEASLEIRALADSSVKGEK